MPNGFHEVSFPMSVALGTTGGPERHTDIVLLSNGHESRNARWRDARRRYDAGSGMKSAQDLYALVAFFEARQGSLYGFRFKDPIDHASSAYGTQINYKDQQIGIGDGVQTIYQLTKSYADIAGGTSRVIQKPVAGSVEIALDHSQIFAPNFTIDMSNGLVTFSSPPEIGAMITAGFNFDVPVRFDIDRLDINLSNFHAGHIPSIPLIEIKPEAVA